MMEIILVRYLHFISLLVMVSSVVAQHLLLKEELSIAEIKRLFRIDAIYGISALLTVGAGLTLWFGVGKPSEFYSQNWVFHTKVTVFVIVGLLSLIPTLFFRKHHKADPSTIIRLPKKVKMAVRLELLLLFIIPLLATFMAQSVGFFGQ